MIEIFDNIRKIYTFSAPCPELADYIEFFSESSALATSQYVGDGLFTVKMFPSFTPTFYINLGTPYYLDLGGERYLVEANEDVLVVRDGIAERYNLPTDHILTVKFFPGGLEAVTGVSQVKCINRVVTLDDIIPAQLIGAVKVLDSFGGRVEMLQNFFLKKLCNKQKKDHYLQFVQDTIQVYEAANMQYNNSQLAEKMFTTSKTIQRYFNTVVGTSPKNYFSMYRARVALTGYVANKSDFDPSVFGYYDMSHFYKDVIKFTGQKLAQQRN